MVCSSCGKENPEGQGKPLLGTDRDGKEVTTTTVRLSDDGSGIDESLPEVPDTI